MINHQVEQIILKELSSGVKLLWAGSPQKGPLFRKSDFAMVPFSVLWLGFAAFWEMKVIEARALPLILWGIPFVLIGLHITVGRFIVDAKLRASTYYGVTNQRVIIISGLLHRKIQTCALKSLRDLTLSEKRDRRGSISFGAENPQFSWFMNLPGGQPTAPYFDTIENPREVYEIIRKAKDTAS